MRGEINEELNIPELSACCGASMGLLCTAGDASPQVCNNCSKPFIPASSNPKPVIIDDNGGGSGRRIKIQLLDILKSI